MGIARGIHIVRDGLVFGYDTGYGVADNNTTTRFYPGEPTTNLYTNSDFSNGETGWTFASWDGNISHSATTVVGPNGNVVSANKLTVNSASSYSHFHQYNNGKYTSGNTYTTSAWVKGTGTFAIKSHWGGNTNFTMTGDWQRVSMTVTASTSSSSNFPYFAGEGLTVGTDFYITDAQTEHKSHATPYVASGSSTGSRSNTASLIDLKRTEDISVANVSFDSTGQPEFDGTDDIIEVSRQIDTADYSAEFVFKADVNTSGTEHWLGAQYTQTTGRIVFDLFTDNTLRNFINGTSITGDTTIATGTWYHAVFTRDSSGAAKIYLNGAQDATGTISTATPLNTDFEIGGSTVLNSREFTGNIAVVKVYNKVLSATEVTQNYNAYKKRFNL
tara:strand:- start:3191 stop:4351 length:1161 start_codon:yes stop_codon:yes gene_type:complete